MPASQLKRLKLSLREQGVTGPQKSKKQKKANAGKSSSERIERSAALQSIRDSFNPFELRQSARPTKFPSASQKTANGKTGQYKDVLHRPGITKSAGEEMRRAKLLPEMQRRSKVGGVVDRRIGEGDVGMTPEERALERFTREKTRRKTGGLFDLEGGDDEGGVGLTHGGRSLEELGGDDFQDTVSIGSEDGDGELLRRKRRRDDEDELEGDDGAELDAEQPERKKTKNEVMQEVMAKSKMHKYERQKTKEDDEDIREELDKGLGDVLALLQGHKRPAPPVQAPKVEVNGEAPPVVNADRQRLIDGLDRVKAAKEYDARLRQLAQDTRAAPSDRAKTEEERLAAEAGRLQKLEAKRLARMQGEPVSDDEEDEVEAKGDDDIEDEIDADDEIVDEAAEFGFTSATAVPQTTTTTQPLILDDEDEFALDDNLIASGSDEDVSLPSDDEESASGSDSEQGDEVVTPVDEEDEFVRDILGTGPNAASLGKPALSQQSNGLAYTYPCPRTHIALLEVIKDVAIPELPTIVQRIRALHHPSLSASNKEAMADFSTALVEHIAYMADQKQPLPVIEQLIRHIHSLSRTYALEIATAFRAHLQGFLERTQPTPGDLVILTAIGSIYPTSDHFHQVVTPAITLMARYLGMTNPTTPALHINGAFLVRLCLSYQKLSKRYIPETVRFALRALGTAKSSETTIQQSHLNNLTNMLDLWKGQPAFTPIFAPFVPLLKNSTHPTAKTTLRTLTTLLTSSHLSLRPLQLHNHKPLAIRPSIPKFEESFNPDKHYDPDKERSDSAKLAKEFKREKKGALRELRKDANFVAREQLREKRERDQAYEKKYRRLVAEIQGEEGRESKEYDKVKRIRKGKR
ncbi:nucleolar complex protein 14 [Oleoguttula sp. CCFEE 5521]